MHVCLNYAKKIQNVCLPGMQVRPLMQLNDVKFTEAVLFRG